MNVYLTFDVEIWCDGWNDLDRRFPDFFERYIYGRSGAGQYALPKTLEILNRYGLHGVFYVESLFAARFGVSYLEKITRQIQEARQEVQLHLHPEWTDEIRPPVFPTRPIKRRHVSDYTLEEQEELIRRGLALLGSAGCRDVTAFRAGNFAANADTLQAVERCGLTIDSSLNASHAISGGLALCEGDRYFPSRRGGLQLLPVSAFLDGFGRARPAQIGACSASELEQAIEESARLGHPCFTVLSHNFEMLRRSSSARDGIVASRFEALCRYLGENRDRFPTAGLSLPLDLPAVPPGATLAKVGAFATCRRMAEQAARRVSDWRGGWRHGLASEIE